MKTEKIGIAIARINGLKNTPYYFDAKCFWACDILFFDTSSLKFTNLPWIWLSENSKSEAEQEYDKLKKNFSDAGIYDGDKVAVMFRENGRVIAIGSIGIDCWIDVENRFVKKNF